MPAELTMRYGCNPHQAAARCYRADGGDLPLEALNGSPSYINLMDALNSWQLVRELSQALSLPAAASFKHVSPAGAAVGVPLDEVMREALFAGNGELSPVACAYARARGADRLASYGDWVALSDTVDESAARLICREVSDGIIAPGYDPEALALLRKKKGGGYRVLRIDPGFEPTGPEVRQVFGHILEQGRNDFVPDKSFYSNVVTKRRDLSEAALRDLTVATIAVKYTQSNSVCLAVDGQVIGAGAGQQSRVHCVRLAAGKADRWYLRQHPRVRGLPFRKGIRRPQRDNAIDVYLEEEVSAAEQRAWEANFTSLPERLTGEEKRQWLDGLQGVAVSSDAFFPFRDNIDRASRSGVEYLVEAGGSVQDQQVIDAADEYGMVMIFSGTRLFHH
ncbi:phosphoribosylaminoimidazolecarboxamide formyltransferase [Candidatus Latescibacterota bacterium]